MKTSGNIMVVPAIVAPATSTATTTTTVAVTSVSNTANHGNSGIEVRAQSGESTPVVKPTRKRKAKGTAFPVVVIVKYIYSI